MTDNLKIWEALGKTAPGATKGFSRAGGFKGTAVKPMWVLKRLTEQFGPAGIGWGVNEPSFQVVNGEGEILVYCTVSAWHGDKANMLWGVGGDKVLAKRNSGNSFHDDEAFKKAFTDAINNAFKSIGVAADIHMGLFDDDKYVAAMEREFNPPEPEKKLPTGPINDKTREWLASQIDHTGLPVGDFLRSFGLTTLKAVTYEHMDEVKVWLHDNKKAA